MKKITTTFLFFILGLIAFSSSGNQSNPLHLIFIDKSLSDVEFLTNNIDLPSSQIIYIDSEKNEGLAKVNDEIQKYDDIQSIHIIGHGKPGELFIGHESFYGDDIYANRSIFSNWKDHVSADADLLLYGCSIASTAKGKTFVENLSTLTGMNVAASNNLTGNTSLGGDWSLEYTSGAVETPIAFSPDVENYENTLQSLDYADLRNYDEVDEGAANDGVWTYPDGSGRTAYQSNNTSKPVYLLSTTSVLNKVFKGTIQVKAEETDNDDIGFAFGFQGVYDTYIWSWCKGDVVMEHRPNGGHLLYHKDGDPSFTVLPGTFLGVVDSEPWAAGSTYQVEILYTSNRIRIKVDGVEKFDVSATDAGVAQFPAGRFGFYNYSQGNVTFGNQQTAPGSDAPIPPTAQDDSYGMSPNTVLTVDRLEGILKNDYDANLDGFTIEKVSGVSHGTLDLDLNDGSFTYEPATDYQGGDEFTYKLVQNEGDGIGTESAVRTVSFGVIDNNEAPTDIQLSNNEVSEGAPLNTVIGEFTTSDANNPQDEHDYVLTNSDGGNFILSGNKLLVNNSSLTAGNRSIEVSSTDLFGQSFTKSFTISVLNNNIPTSANSTIYTSKNADYTFATSDFPFSDNDAGDTFGGIRIETLETAGDLEYNGSDVFAESIIDDITNLVFRSPVDASGTPYSTFTFKVFDSKGGISAASYTMNINVVEAVTWIGATDTDWNKATNWNPAVVPTQYVDATIPSAPSIYPVIKNTVNAGTKDLNINVAGTDKLTINSGGKLTIHGEYNAITNTQIKVE